MSSLYICLLYALYICAFWGLQKKGAQGKKGLRKKGPKEKRTKKKGAQEKRTKKKGAQGKRGPTVFGKSKKVLNLIKRDNIRNFFFLFQKMCQSYLLVKEPGEWIPLHTYDQIQDVVHKSSILFFPVENLALIL